MKLIIWLWNPWDKYKYTRHNVWFMFINYFAKKENFPDFKYESRFKADYCSWIFQWEKTILLKPQTFMNLSWEAIQKIVNFYKIEKEDFIVVYDDFSMDFSKIRYRNKWSAWWHNGVKDIIKYFSKDFKRIKVWVWLDEKYEISDWVLSRFKEEELIDLENDVFSSVYDMLEDKI